MSINVVTSVEERNIEAQYLNKTRVYYKKVYNKKKNWIKVILLDLWLWLSQKPKTWAIFDKERFIQEIYIVLKLWNLGFKISGLILACLVYWTHIKFNDLWHVRRNSVLLYFNHQLKKSRISSVYITAIPNKIFWDQFTKFSKLQFLQKVKYLALFQFLSTISKYWELGYACP